MDDVCKTAREMTRARAMDGRVGTALEAIENVVWQFIRDLGVTWDRNDAPARERTDELPIVLDALPHEAECTADRVVEMLNHAREQLITVHSLPRPGEVVSCGANRR